MIRRPTKGMKPPPDGKTEAAAGDEGADYQAYNFRFVEVGEPSQGGDDDSRTTIRSHVMRDYYEKKDNRRRPSTLPETSSAASQKGGVLQQTHRFKVGPQGLQEVKAGRKKSKGMSRATKKASNGATNFPNFKNSQVHTHSSPGLPRAPHFRQPESAASALPAHWTQQLEGVIEGGQWSAADTDIIIRDPHFAAPIRLRQPQHRASRTTLLIKFWSYRSFQHAACLVFTSHAASSLSW
jgi:hypothetical protein